MKIAFEINEKYKKPEIHICSDRDYHESRKIYMTVMEVFEKNITAYDDNEPVMIRHGDIVRIFTQNKNVYLLTEKRQYRLRERLYELEDILDSDSFVRISNSEIVNVKKIIRLDTSITGTIRMYMKGDTQTFVSRRYVSRIKKTLKL